jgi:hypothetical protein
VNLRFGKRKQHLADAATQAEVKLGQFDAPARMDLLQVQEKHRKNYNLKLFLFTVENDDLQAIN